MLNQMTDLMFLFDIIIIFNSAFYDEDFNLVQDRKSIAILYIQTWFFIDLLAIMPFDLIFGNSKNLNEVVRIARIGRMYKLIKLTRMFKVFKILKEKNKMFKYI